MATFEENTTSNAAHPAVADENRGNGLEPLSNNNSVTSSNNNKCESTSNSNCDATVINICETPSNRNYEVTSNNNCEAISNIKCEAASNNNREATYYNNNGEVTSKNNCEARMNNNCKATSKIKCEVTSNNKREAKSNNNGEATSNNTCEARMNNAYDRTSNNQDVAKSSDGYAQPTAYQYQQTQVYSTQRPPYQNGQQYQSAPPYQNDQQYQSAPPYPPAPSYPPPGDQQVVVVYTSPPQQQYAGNPPPPPAFVVVVEQPPPAYFEDPAERRAFIGKVYTILLCQLLVMFGCVASTVFIDEVERAFKEYPGIGYIIIACMVICMVILCCGVELMMKSPTNYFILVFVTLTYSAGAAWVASNYAHMEVLIAMAATCVTVIFLTFLACVIKKDLTVCLEAAMAALVVLFILGLLSVFVVQQKDFKAVNLVFSYIGAIIFCVFIVIDTQMLMDGKKYSLTPDMAVFAAINLFLDVYNLFLCILSITAGSGGD